MVPRRWANLVTVILIPNSIPFWELSWLSPKFVLGYILSLPFFPFPLHCGPIFPKLETRTRIEFLSPVRFYPVT